MTLRLTEDQRLAHQRKIHGNNQNHNSRTGADMEQRAGNATQRQNATEEALPPVVIRFTHYRRKLADRDNFATKWLTDALVKNGLLRDDSPEEVEDVIHKQVKVEQWEEEKTVIEIIEAHKIQVLT